MRAKSVANAILRRGFEEDEPITPMKLQKMMFYTYRDYLKRTNTSLFPENIEVWKRGPVIRCIYEEFRGFGGNPITRYATESDCKTSYIVRDDAKVFWDVFETMWNRCIGCNGSELADHTHEDGGAWDRTRKDGNMNIPDDYIREDNTFYAA